MSADSPSSEMGADLYFGSPDGPPPDWRGDDPDDEIDDNEDPAPIAPQILMDILGFDPDGGDKDKNDDDSGGIGPDRGRS